MSRQREAHITDIWVLERSAQALSGIPLFKRKVIHKNKGYASQLLKMAISHCEELGAESIYVSTQHEVQLRVMQWFHRYGFIPVNSKKMVLTLKSSTKVS